jgi:hypothetical protein
MLVAEILEGFFICSLIFGLSLLVLMGKLFVGFL